MYCGRVIGLRVGNRHARSRIIGVQTCMRSFDFLFGAMLGELLLRHTDNLSKTLQSPGISAADGQVAAAMTVKTIQSLRTDENFVLKSSG